MQDDLGEYREVIGSDAALPFVRHDSVLQNPRGGGSFQKLIGEAIID